MTHETALRGTLAALKKSRPTGEYAFSAEAAELHEAAIDDAEAALAVTAPVQSNESWLKEAERLVDEYALQMAFAPINEIPHKRTPLLAHLRNHPAAVPEGFVLVPVEPTKAMLRAIRKQRSGARVGKGDRDNWKVMIAATKAGKE